MKYQLTRDVVTDLWSLCRSAGASAESQALVDAYLAQDPDLAHTLQASEAVKRAIPPMRFSADAERRLLDDIRQRARMKMMVIGGAVATTGVLLLASLAGALFLVFGTR